jgi:hypothetical protein
MSEYGGVSEAAATAGVEYTQNTAVALAEPNINQEKVVTMHDRGREQGLAFNVAFMQMLHHWPNLDPYGLLCLHVISDLGVDPITLSAHRPTMSHPTSFLLAMPASFGL